MSNTDHGYKALGKYSSARDDILHYLCTSAWANESFGDVEAPTGYVWRISNSWAEVKPASMDFTAVLEGWLEWNQEVTDSEELRRELVGYFLVQENSNGLVHVREYLTEAALLADFRTLERDFYIWDDSNEDEEA